MRFFLSVNRNKSKNIDNTCGRLVHSCAEKGEGEGEGERERVSNVSSVFKASVSPPVCEKVLRHCHI